MAERDVSIHAPVRMRQSDVFTVAVLYVSIHAPVRMRPSTATNITQADGFNSRTREDATKTKN